MCQIENELTIKGYYVPSFLHLRVNTNDNLSDLDLIIKNNFSTFFHEYIHFYQDVSTSYGLMNSILIIEIIKHMNVLMKENSKFTVPLQIDDRWHTNINIKLKDIYYGDGKLKSGNRIIVEDIIKQEETFRLLNGSIIKINKLILFYNDYINHDKGQFTFGAKHIKESMAHFAQSILFPGTIHNDVPYLVIERLIDKYCKKLSGKSELLFALCDASLMNFHPAEILYDKICEIEKDSDFNPNKPEEIYDYFFRNDIIFGGHFETSDSLYEKLVDLNKEELSDAMKADIFEDNRNWLNIMFNQAQIFRNKKSFVFYDLFASSVSERVEKFKTIIANLGSTFITNISWEGSFYLLNGFTIKTDYFTPYSSLVFLQYFGLTTKGVIKCLLKPFCKNSKEGDITDANCDNSPWLRCEYQKLCPFGAFWRTWELTGHYPNK